MKQLYRLLRRVVLSFGLLYAYNIFMHQYELPIPINLITVPFVTVFSIPGFIGLIIFYLINFR
ncbi:MAG: pro-sigmaK processing inhibitor BofA family protein [Bacilli bacterium]|nr:pro-sigmaK processing inhibitor BofA family protein [Bacilli bacterium]